jgi:mono/diheme cytochrome c family protein
VRSTRLHALPPLVAALVLGALACDRLPGRPDEADRHRRPAEILDFDTLYAVNCSGCHGAEGTLGPSRPLADPVYLALVSPARVAEVVTHGRGVTMPAFAQSAGGTITEEQVDAVASGLFERWASPAKLAGVALPPYDEKDSLARGHQPGDPARGARAYATFCADCHGTDGHGGEDGGSVVDPSFLALVSDQMLRTSVIAGRPDLDMPDWRTVSDERPMTPQEISDVVAWMAARRVPFPGQPYASALGADAAGR